VAQANVKLTVDASQATRALKGVQQQSSGLQRAFGGLKTAILGVGVTALGRQAILTSANFEKLNVRLGLLTKASGTFAKSQEIAAEAQKLFGLSATEALEGITNITARLQPLGVGVEDIRTTFIGFNTAAKLAGASAMESSNAFRQLAQALGSGRLQGDEFRSIAEQVPTILAPIAAELGVTIGELKKFASEGKLTSDVVIRALKKVELDGADSLKALLENDPTQVFKNLGNEAENLSRAFGDQLAPAVLPVIRALTKVTEAITNFVKSGAGQVTLIFTAIAVAAKGVAIITPVIIGQLATLATSFQVAAINSALASTGLKGVAASSFLAAGGITKATIALSALKIALIKTGIGAAIVVLGSLAAKFIDNKNAAKEAADAAKAFDDNIKGIVETAETTEFALNKLAIARKEFELSQLSTNRSDRGTAKRLERELEILKERSIILQGEKERDAQLALDKAFNDQTIALLKNISAMEAKLAGKEEEFNMEQRINELKEKFGELDAQQIIDLIKQEELLKKKVEIMTKQEEIAKKINGAFKQIGEDIGTGITDALVGAIEGTRTLGEAAKSIINDLASSLLRLGVQMALTGLFGGTKIGGFLGFANGGRPPVGKPSIVGERGPEIFVPRSAGTIIPNNQIGGVGGGIVNNINVNVSAEGMQSNANEDRGKELGVALASAIQSELIKQKRPGGLLAT
jgi:tape measure domain-containing protein